MTALPMFPLGSVLLPGEPLPLHVFEPRYRALVRHLLDEAAAGRPPEFGVVLIERGSEVGGADQRSPVGTVARVLEVGELPDGRYVLATVGVRRIRVVEWLPDDPYPVADVDDWPDADAAPGMAEHPSGVSPEALASVHARVRRAAALAVELGDDAALASGSLDDDPSLASFQLVAMAPISSLDRQHLLAAATAAGRLEALSAALHDLEQVQQFRLAP